MLQICISAPIFTTKKAITHHQIHHSPLHASSTVHNFNLCVLFKFPLLELPFVRISVEDRYHLVLVFKELLGVIFGVFELLLYELGPLEIGFDNFLHLGYLFSEVTMRKLVQLPVQRIELRTELLLHVADVFDLRGQVVDLPAVDLLQNVLLIRQLVDGRLLGLLRLDVRVAQEVVVPRLPGVPVALHQLHLRALEYHWAVATVLSMSIIAAAPSQRSCHVAARRDLSFPIL